MIRARPLLGLLVALIVSSLASPALAQEQTSNQEAAAVDLRLSIPGNPDVPPQFVATVRDGAGNVIPGVVVEFSRELEFLGTTRFASLGSTITDTGGTARLVVLPRQKYSTIIASVPGSEAEALIDATFPEDRVDTFFNPEHEHGLLTPLRDIMPPLIAAVVALLWIFVIGLVVRTMRRLRDLADREEGVIA